MQLNTAIHFPLNLVRKKLLISSLANKQNTLNLMEGNSEGHGVDRSPLTWEMAVRRNWAERTWGENEASCCKNLLLMDLNILLAIVVSQPVYLLLIFFFAQWFLVVVLGFSGGWGSGGWRRGSHKKKSNHLLILELCSLPRTLGSVYS